MKEQPKPQIERIKDLFEDPDKAKPLFIETPYPNDDVNHPDHYTMGIEVTDFLASWEVDWFRGNIIKYVIRCPFKNNTLKDLKKAKWYLDDLIKRVERNEYTI